MADDDARINQLCVHAGWCCKQGHTIAGPAGAAAERKRPHLRSLLVLSRQQQARVRWQVRSSVGLARPHRSCARAGNVAKSRGLVTAVPDVRFAGCVSRGGSSENGGLTHRRERRRFVLLGRKHEDGEEEDRGGDHLDEDGLHAHHAVLSGPSQ